MRALGREQDGEEGRTLASSQARFERSANGTIFVLMQAPSIE